MTVKELIKELEKYPDNIEVKYREEGEPLPIYRDKWFCPDNNTLVIS